MRATLEEVARLAGVSTSTASRALHGEEGVLPATRTRVQDAARALRYRPNRTAAALRTRRTHLLGLVVNSLYNATFTTLADVLQTNAASSGYQLLVCTTDGDPYREAAFLDTALDHGMEGVIVAGTGENLQRISHLRESGIGVVVMNRDVPGSHAPSVMPDYQEASAMASHHLLDLRHERIAYIGGLERFTSGREHHAGFVATLSARGVAVDPTMVRKGPFNPDFGSRAARELLDTTEPTALLVTNHEATFGVLPVLVERGIAIPDSLSVVCTEDAPWFAWWHPPLTVVQTRAAHMAERALDLLIQQISGAPSTLRDHHEVVQPVLVPRGSTSPL